MQYQQTEVKRVHRDRICCIENQKHCHRPGLANYLDDIDEANRRNSNHDTYIKKQKQQTNKKHAHLLRLQLTLYKQRRLYMPTSCWAHTRPIGEGVVFDDVTLYVHNPFAL